MDLHAENTDFDQIKTKTTQPNEKMFARTICYIFFSLPHAKRGQPFWFFKFFGKYYRIYCHFISKLKSKFTTEKIEILIEALKLVNMLFFFLI